MRLSEEKITRGNAVAVKAAVLASAQAGDTVLDGFDVRVNSDVVGAYASVRGAHAGNPLRAGKNALSDAALRCERSACAVLQVRQKKKFRKPP